MFKSELKIRRTFLLQTKLILSQALSTHLKAKSKCIHLKLNTLISTITCNAVWWMNTVFSSQLFPFGASSCLLHLLLFLPSLCIAHVEYVYEKCELFGAAFSPPASLNILFFRRHSRTRVPAQTLTTDVPKQVSLMEL